MIALTYLYHLIKARVHFWMRSATPASASYHMLTQSHSYRMVGNNPSRLTIGFTYLKLAAGVLFRNEDGQKVHENNGAALFDGSFKFFPERAAYFDGLVHPNPGISLGRDVLMIKGYGLSKAVGLIGLSLLFLMYLPHLLLSSRRNNYALLLLEYSEWIVLHLQCKKLAVQKLYILSGYEKDVNFICYLAAQQGIFTHRIPSSNPLMPFYEKVVCDQFSFTAGYQRDQKASLSDWYVRQYDDMPPFNYKTLLSAPKTVLDEAKNTIGFISSGVWRRKERGDMAVGLGEYESEDELMRLLKEMVSTHPNWSLYIYLHPTEKKPVEIFNKSVAHYQEYFKGIDLKIIDSNEPSYSQFNACEVAVSVYSSANIERMFMGMKVYYFPAHFHHNPFASTSLENVVITKSEDLKKRIEAAMSMEALTFFEENNIVEYISFGLHKSHSETENQSS